jgi:hypothetical protein
MAVPPFSKLLHGMVLIKCEANITLASLYWLILHKYFNLYGLQLLRSDLYRYYLETSAVFLGSIAELMWSHSTLESSLNYWNNLGFSGVYLHVYLLTYGAKPFLRSCHLCSHSRTSQQFIEPENSLLSSREPSTFPYPEPDWSSPYHPILFL